MAILSCFINVLQSGRVNGLSATPFSAEISITERVLFATQLQGKKKKRMRAHVENATRYRPLRSSFPRLPRSLRNAHAERPAHDEPWRLRLMVGTEGLSVYGPSPA